jgi:tetratricopeptide (TPR) repeat protein
VILGLSALLAAGAADAEGGAPPDLLTLGKQEYMVAISELNLGHYESALEHLEASYRLTSKPALLFNLAYVHGQLFQRDRKIERLEKSIELYRSYLANTRDSTEPDVIAQRTRAESALGVSLETLGQERAARARGEEALALGEDLVTQGRPADARAQLERFLRTPGNERPGLARAFLLRARIATAEGAPEAASDAYARAVTLDRTVELAANATTAEREAFLQAKGRASTLPPLSVSHTPPASLKPGRPMELAFVSSPDPFALMSRLQVFYRVGGGAYSSITSPLGRVSLPAMFANGLLAGAKVQYYANVEDGNGAILQHLGGASLPFSVEVERAAPPSLARRWWLWTVVVAVAGAAAAGIALGVIYGQPQPKQIPIVTGFGAAR